MMPFGNFRVSFLTNIIFLLKIERAFTALSNQLLKSKCAVGRYPNGFYDVCAEH